MTIQTSTLRPGLLVSLKTSTRGNVSWQRFDLETGKRLEDGSTVARWETKRTIVDPVEWEAAAKARSNAAGVIKKVCAYSAFGLLCPETDVAELADAIKESRRIVDAFNAEAKLTRVNVYVMTGRIAADDVEAVKAINSEVRDLLADMEEGIRNCDPKTIREAAQKAKNIGSMLSGDAQVRVKIAIDTARAAAKEIVKAGEQAAIEVDQRAVRKVREARTAFLDLDEAAPIAAPKQKARAIDLLPAQLVSPPKPKKAKARELMGE